MYLLRDLARRKGNASPARASIWYAVGFAQIPRRRGRERAGTPGGGTFCRRRASCAACAAPALRWLGGSSPTQTISRSASTKNPYTSRRRACRRAWRGGGVAPGGIAAPRQSIGAPAASPRRGSQSGHLRHRRAEAVNRGTCGIAAPKQSIGAPAASPRRSSQSGHLRHRRAEAVNRGTCGIAALGQSIGAPMRETWLTNWRKLIFLVQHGE
jgi:hypothetical protein